MVDDSWILSNIHFRLYSKFNVFGAKSRNEFNFFGAKMTCIKTMRHKAIQYFEVMFSAPNASISHIQCIFMDT